MLWLGRGSGWSGGASVSAVSGRLGALLGLLRLAFSRTHRVVSATWYFWAIEWFCLGFPVGDEDSLVQVPVVNPSATGFAQ